MEELIEGYYGNDGRTAYVMSSDHGMTDWGRFNLTDFASIVSFLSAKMTKLTSILIIANIFSQKWCDLLIFMALFFEDIRLKHLFLSKHTEFIIQVHELKAVDFDET